jgi:hypothetical protein
MGRKTKLQPILQRPAPPLHHLRPATPAGAASVWPGAHEATLKTL